MPTAHTTLTIYNAALDIVSERPAASLIEDRKEVRWLSRNYIHYVQTALRQNPWNFAIEFHTLNQQVSAPAFRWLWGYDLPNGWLRVMPLTYLGQRGGTPIPHEVKGNALYSDLNDPLYAELVMDQQDPGTWDPLFASLIAARLAQGMAHSLTHKTSFMDRATKLATDAYETAELVNAFEGTPEPTEQFDILRVRGF